MAGGRLGAWHWLRAASPCYFSSIPHPPYVTDPTNSSDPGRPKHEELRARLQAAFGTSVVIERELGGGGMSVVFLALEPLLERRVAIKSLSPALTGVVDAERFKREILVSARLQHPHIVPVLRAGEADGIPYFVMPYVEGESLRKRLARTRAMPMAEAVRVLRSVAAALAYAHERGIVHRDIKPDNVLLSTAGSATVTDFGVARALLASTRRAGGEGGDASTISRPLTEAGFVVGTPAYMAPEQAAGDPAVDHRADLYAFGVLAYELFTGSPPFAGRPPQAVLTAHLTETPSDVRVRRPDLPATVAALVMRCLEKKPADRPRSAQSLVNTFDALLAPGGDVSRAERDAFDTGPRGQRRRLLRRIGIAAAAVAILGAVAALARFTRADDVVDVSARGRVVLTSVIAPGADTVLSGVLAETFRTELAQSGTVSGLAPIHLERALGVLCVQPSAPLSVLRARAVAALTDAPVVAIAETGVTAVGGVHSATGRLLDPWTGEVLAAHRESAPSLDAVLPALERLALRMREDAERIARSGATRRPDGVAAPIGTSECRPPGGTAPTNP